MSKLKIKEVIVVEGKHDHEHLLHYVEADIIVSNGLHISKEFLDLCKRLNEAQGIIVFTDPDGPGEAIRRKIMAYVGVCKHATLHVIQTKKKQKVGIEHADGEDIIQALMSCATFDQVKKSLSLGDFNDLGLSGRSDSQLRRDLLSQTFCFPRSNAKGCLKYLNMLGKTLEECHDVLRSEGL